MAFKNIIVKLRQALLCCSKRDQKQPMDIGSPTNVRRIDISDTLPGLTASECAYIREKASSDAIHLLGLHSRPHSQPPSHPPSTTASPDTTPSISRVSSREPSVAPLNAASDNLPSAVPTPPRHVYTEFETPVGGARERLKGMHVHAHDRRDSTSSSTDVDESIEPIPDPPAAQGLNESFMTLNLSFDWEANTNTNKHKTESESARSLDFSEGSEMQDTMGGHGRMDSPVETRGDGKKGGVSASLAESSDGSEVGGDGGALGRGVRLLLGLDDDD